MTESKRNVPTQPATNPRPGDFPVGSHQSRAAARLRLQGELGLGIGAEECICFPEGEEPYFLENEDQERAAKIQCPLHGKRFEARYHFFVAEWHWRSELKRQWSRLTTQYHRAFVASFPEGHRLRKAIEAIADRDNQGRPGVADAETNVRD